MNQQNEKDVEWVERILGTQKEPMHAAVSTSVESTAGAVAETLDSDPNYDGVMRSLHPLLQQALRNPLAKDRLTKKLKATGVDAQVLVFIGDLNKNIDLLMTQLSDSKGYFYKQWGSKLMSDLYLYSNELKKNGLLDTLITALQVFAQTTLREEAKKPTRNPHDQSEFERECTINGIISDLIKGLPTPSRYFPR